MKNYERYINMTPRQYYKKNLSYFLMGIPEEKFLVPYLTGIHGEDILDVGIGYGGRHMDYLKNNNVTGYDINPELGRGLGIEIIRGNAVDLGKLGRKFDRILSVSMTEYLNKDELRSFILGAIECLNPGGSLGFTVIMNRGIGRLYVTMAKMKGIDKYSYSPEIVSEIIGDNSFSITPIRSALGAYFAFWVEYRK